MRTKRRIRGFRKYGSMALLVAVFGVAGLNVSCKGEKLFKIKQGELYGYINQSGKVTIEPQFNSARQFREGMAAVEINGKWGYIDRNGEISIAPTFSKSDSFYEGLAGVWLQTQTGHEYCFYIDKKGDLAFDVPNDALRRRSRQGCFHEGAAAVLVGERWGYIDKKGRMFISPSYLEASDFSEGLAAVDLDYRNTDSGPIKQKRYIDKDGRVALNVHISKHDFLWYCFPEIYHEYSSNRWDYIENENGDRMDIDDPEVGILSDFHEGLASVTIWAFLHTKSLWRNEGGEIVHAQNRSHSKLIAKSGYINKEGFWVIRPKYDFAGDFSKGIARVEIDEKWGYIDKNGNAVIEPTFDYMYEFCEGLAGVEIDGKYGFIDRNGNIAIEPHFDGVGEGFSSGVAMVFYDEEKWGYISKNGESIWSNIK